jgi:hypothetical protein
MQVKTKAIWFALALALASASSAHAGWGVRIGIGLPFPGYYYGGPYYGPYYGYPYGYYAPPVVVAQPQTVYVTQPAAPPRSTSSYTAPTPPAPVETLPAPRPGETAEPPQASGTPTSLSSSVTRTAAPVVNTREDNALVQQLNDPQENVRINAVMQLGRNRVVSAVSPLSQLLANDRSVAVRESAARALGLIAAPESLNALQRAAQADDDREVRHSAQFAAEIIRGNLQQR